MDRKAHGAILTSIGSEHMALVVNTKSAFQAWNNIMDHFAKAHVSAAREMALTTMLNTLRLKKGESIDAFHLRLIHICNELAGVNFIVTEKAKKLTFLRGVMKTYPTAGLVLSWAHDENKSYSELVGHFALNETLANDDDGPSGGYGGAMYGRGNGGGGG